MNIMNIQQLSIKRAGKKLFGDFSCQLEKGTITVILGPNGAGKSSLLLAMAALIPIQGRIDIMGTELINMQQKERCRKVAWQGDLPPTEFGLNVEQRLSLAVQDQHANDKIEHSLATMAITSLRKRTLSALSSGERQRVELAALLLREAPLWLLDEPTSHLDLKHQIHCLQVLKQQAKAGRCIALVLHDLQQAIALADFVILLDGHGGIEYGTSQSLLQSQRLSQTFDAPLIIQKNALLPDYQCQTQMKQQSSRP